MNKTELIKKWSDIEGKISITDIEDDNIKENMAQLLENQETKNLKSELLAETTTFTNGTPGDEASGQFKPIAMALVRRTFPNLFANKVVGVQSMTGPVGLAYALRFKYNDGSGVEAAWKKVNNYTGYTGSTSGVSGSSDVGTGVSGTVGEGWKLPPADPAVMPELKLTLDRKAIDAKTRKLAASFSLEAAQDIRAMHNVDIEKEMVNVLQYEVLAEIDREIVARLKAAAVDVSNGGETATSVDVSATDGRWSQEKYTTVVTTIVKKANDIATATKRGAGNFAIVSPRVATALQAAGKQFSNNVADVNATGTLVNVGSINNTITIYRDAYAVSDFALVGYKGPGVSDAGLIYSPYITGLVQRAIAEEDFSPRIGTMSRYALTDTLLGSGNYYRLINFTNLDTVLGA